MVMDYVQAALRGDVSEAAKLSFDCISCGLCAVRCPAEIVPYNIAQRARRLYSKYVDGPAEHVLEKVKEVEPVSQVCQELENDDLLLTQAKALLQTSGIFFMNEMELAIAARAMIVAVTRDAVLEEMERYEEARRKNRQKRKRLQERNDKRVLKTTIGDMIKFKQGSE